MLAQDCYEIRLLNKKNQIFQIKIFYNLKN